MGFNRFFKYEDHPPWFWLLWSLLWPIMAAHLGHWAGPYVLPLFPKFLFVAHNLFWDPLLPPTSTQMADLGWWLGLFFGIINWGFQSATWDFEEARHPHDWRFEAPASDIFFPMPAVESAIMEVYIDFGVISFVIEAASTVGTPIALVKLVLWWGAVHHWPPPIAGIGSTVSLYAQGQSALVYILLVSAALIVGSFAGIMLGMPLSVLVESLRRDLVKLWKPVLTSQGQGGKLPSEPPSPPDPPTPPPPKRIRL